MHGHKKLKVNKLMPIFNICPTALSNPLIVNCKTNFRVGAKSSYSLQFTSIWYMEIE